MLRALTSTSDSLHLSQPSTSLDPTGHGLQARSATFTACPPQIANSRELDGPNPPSAPRKQFLKRKAASSRLSVKQQHGPQSRLRAPDAAPLISHYQQQSLTHPDYPLSNNIHSFAWDLKPRYIASSHNLRGAPILLSAERGHVKNQTRRCWSDSGTSFGHGTLPDEYFQYRSGQQPMYELIPADSNRQRVLSGLSDASTPSLSCFPQPPWSHQGTVPNSSVDRTEPETPATYHLRGASFEILNPRQSLYAKDIETPAAEQTDSQDYFVKLLLPNMAPGGQIRITPSPILLADSNIGQTSSRLTPHRSLFDDLPSAYNSIRSGRRVRGAVEEDDDVSLLRDSQPIGTKTSTALPEPHIETPTRPSRAVTSVSVKQRLSQVLRLGRQEKEEWRKSQTQPNMSANLNVARDTFFGEGDASNHIHWAFHEDEDRSEIDEARRDSLDGPSQFFTQSPTSSVASADRDSESCFPLVFSPQRPHSSRSTNMSRDESTADIIAAYGDSSANASPRSNKRPSPLRHQSMPVLPQSGRMMPEGTSSTIGIIIDQYHREDDSRDLAGNDASPMPYRRASMPLVSRADVAKNPSRPPAKPHGAWRDQDVRTATARALRAPIGRAPLLPLPISPGCLMAQSRGPHPSTPNDTDTPSKASYGDTRKLLMLSSTPAETGRDEEFKGSPHAGGTFNPNVSPAPDAAKRISSRSFDEIVEKDIRYFSRLSGMSQLSGSIFVFDSEQEDSAPQKSRLSAFNFEFDTKAMEGAFQAPPLLLKRAETVPVADFAQRTVEPGIMRLTQGQRDAVESFNPEPSSNHDARSEITDDDAENDDNEDNDWQTVSDSRRTLRSRSHLTEGESLVDVSSYNSMSTFLEANIHSAYQAYGEGRRRTPPTRLRPPMSLHPDDAATYPAPALYTTYRHQSPLSDVHDNPFTSSPPQIAGATSSRSRTDAFADPAAVASQAAYDHAMMYHNRNLSVIPEQTEQGHTADFRFRADTSLIDVQSSGSSIALSAGESTVDLGSEPGPSISLEAENGSPTDWQKARTKPLTTRLSSGADPALLQRLRADDPRQASSPLSRSNSFAKVSRLGIKGNITGTPDGTGMRAAGSSEISSSPPVMLDSSPVRAMAAKSPATPPTPQSILGWGLPPVTRSGSPLAQQAWPRFVVNEKERVDQEQRLSRDPTGFRSPYDQPLPRLPSRAVAGQRSLLQMKLQSKERRHQQQDLADRIARVSHDAANPKADRRPLLPLNSSPAEPRLRSRYRSPSSHASELRERKRRISWICFALCALFPYLLILYGHSGLDAVMSTVTKGQIQHFGQKQKKVARIVGWTTAAATVATLIIAFVVIRTVPNDFPR